MPESSILSILARFPRVHESPACFLSEKLILEFRSFVRAEGSHHCKIDSQ